MGLLQEAQRALMAELDELERVKAEDFLDKAQTAAEAQWTRVERGAAGSRLRGPRADTTYMGPDEHALTRVSEEETDDSSPETGGGSSSQHLQQQLAKLQDCTRLRRLEKELQDQCTSEQSDRLRELRRPEVSHRWL